MNIFNIINFIIRLFLNFHVGIMRLPTLNFVNFMIAAGTQHIGKLGYIRNLQKQSFAYLTKAFKYILLIEQNS